MPIQYQNFLWFQLIASMVRTSNLRFNFFRTVIQIAKWAFVSLSSSKGVKHYILKKICHKVSAALLSALPLFVHLTAYLIQLDSDNETTLNFFSEGDENHTLAVALIHAGHCPGSVMLLLVSKEKPVVFTGDFRWQIGHTKQIIFLTIYKKLLFTILILFTSTPRFLQNRIFYLVRRDVFQPSFKPCPRGSVHFNMT